MEAYAAPNTDFVLVTATSPPAVTSPVDALAFVSDTPVNIRSCALDEPTTRRPAPMKNVAGDLAPYKSDDDGALIVPCKRLAADSTGLVLEQSKVSALGAAPTVNKKLALLPDARHPSAEDIAPSEPVISVPAVAVPAVSVRMLAYHSAPAREKNAVLLALIALYAVLVRYAVGAVPMLMLLAASVVPVSLKTDT